jgi:hypothetical protein
LTVFVFFLEFLSYRGALPFEKRWASKELALKDAAHGTGNTPTICIKFSIMNLQRIRVFPSKSSWFWS